MWLSLSSLNSLGELVFFLYQSVIISYHYIITIVSYNQNNYIIYVYIYIYQLCSLSSVITIITTRHTPETGRVVEFSQALAALAWSLRLAVWKAWEIFTRPWIKRKCEHSRNVAA